MVLCGAKIYSTKAAGSVDEVGTMPCRIPEATSSTYTPTDVLHDENLYFVTLYFSASI